MLVSKVIRHLSIESTENSFEQYVKENEELHAYIESYYRKKMTEAIYRQRTHDNEWEKWSRVCIYLSFDSVIW